MFSRLVNGDTRRREVRVGKHSDGDCQEFLQPLWLVVDGGTALGAEMKLDSGALITDADVLSGGTRNRHIFARKPGLLPKDTASSSLTSQAMTDGNADRLADDLRCELATAT